MSTRIGEHGEKVFHILVTTDLSPDAESAFATAAKEVRLRSDKNCRVTLFSVVENPFAAVFDIDLGSDRESVWVESENETKRLLGHLRDRYFDPISTSCVTSRQVGSVADEIGKYARTHLIDMIIIASHGRTGLSRTLFGSVAEQVVRHSRCPVLVVPVVPIP